MQFLILRIDEIEPLQRGYGLIFVAGAIFERGQLLDGRGTAAAFGAVFFELGDGSGVVVLGLVRGGERLVNAVVFHVIRIPVANRVALRNHLVVVLRVQRFADFIGALLP